MSPTQRGRRATRRVLKEDTKEAAGDAASSVDDLLKDILPYAPAMLKTIGLAGSATSGEDGKDIPGNVQAASIGLDFIVKALTGRSSSKAREVLDAITQLRETALAQARED